MVEPIDKSPTELGFITGVKCTDCGMHYSLSNLKEKHGTIFQYFCEEDYGEFIPILDINRLKPILNSHTAKERFETSPTYWGLFPELLPLAWDDNKPKIYTQDIPFSPLDKSVRIGKELGIPELYFLDDGTMDSFKSRAVNAAANIAKESGYDTMVNASTGNLVIACLNIGSKAEFNVTALLPEALSNGKKKRVEQIAEIARNYGKTIEVKYFHNDYTSINDTIAGPLIDEYNDGNDLLKAFSPNRGPRTWYGMGEWTAAFQFVTQLYYQHGIKRNVPINIYVGMGSGKLTSMITEACKVMQKLNILENPIRVWGIQPTKNQPIVEGYLKDVQPSLEQGIGYEQIKGKIEPRFGKDTLGTIVESVAIQNPGSFMHTLKSLSNPNSNPKWNDIRGGAVVVDDIATVDGLVELVLKEEKTPQFVGAMAYQGLRNVIKKHPEIRKEIHVVYLTGGGKGKIGQTLEDMARKNFGRRKKQLAEIAPYF